MASAAPFPLDKGLLIDVNRRSYGVLKLRIEPGTNQRTSTMHTRSCLALALFLAFSGAIWSDDYRLPPREVVQIVDAPPPPGVRLSPDRQWMLLVERSALPTTRPKDSTVTEH